MVFSAEESLTMAAFYDEAAANGRAPRELRMAFARKANWLRILARLEADKHQSVHLATCQQAPDEKPPVQAKRKHSWIFDCVTAHTIAKRKALKSQRCGVPVPANTPVA